MITKQFIIYWMCWANVNLIIYNILREKSVKIDNLMFNFHNIFYAKVFHYTIQFSLFPFQLWSHCLNGFFYRFRKKFYFSHRVYELTKKRLNYIDVDLAIWLDLEQLQKFFLVILITKQGENPDGNCIPQKQNLIAVNAFQSFTLQKCKG